MKLIAEEYPHRSPWWSCFGCWKIVTLLLLYAMAAGFTLRNFFCER